ncbi:hypothetical protein EYR38_006298 [Pleurotus pulmonarius]|nr:hypothetical protein EYR38_006298 [Pleurotus pulmonarius]
MVFSCRILALALFTTTAIAVPLCTKRTYNGITPAQLIQIAPEMAACNATAPFPEECRDAKQSAPFVNQGFEDYAITSKGEKAAILSLMLFESGNFKFDINHFPGRPGQGTRNLMTFPFVHQYAVDTPSTSAQALALAPNASDPSISNDTMNAVRALVLEDRLSFASGMWFYKASGPEKIGCTGNSTLVEGLKAETEQGWADYITNCIFTTVTDERKAVWQKTLAAI